MCGKVQQVPPKDSGGRFVVEAFHEGQWVPWSTWEDYESARTDAASLAAFIGMPARIFPPKRSVSGTAPAANEEETVTGNKFIPFTLDTTEFKTVIEGLQKELGQEIFFTLDSYQHEALKTAVFPHNKALEYLTLGLVSEAGEVAGKVKKHIRDRASLDALTAELGDVLWYVAVLADYLGSDLSDVANANLTKLRDRQSRGALGGDGDDR